MDSNDTILVTGGTGFTGARLVRALVASGAHVRVIARATSDRSQLQDLPVEWFVGEVHDPDTVNSAVEGVNYIFHVAAAYREAKISDEIYRKVHVDSTQLLSNAAMKQPDFKRFIHVSTVGVHGHIESPPADEEYRFAPGDEYQNTKVEGERWIRNFSIEEGLPLTVIRPAAIYGPGDRRLLKIFKLAKLPVCPLVGLGSKGLYHLIHVDDLVRFMMHVSDDDRAAGEVFICGNEEPSSIKEIVEIISGFLDKQPRFIRMPATPFFLAGDVCEFICKPFGIEPPIYRRRVAFFTKDRSFDTSKMRRLTDFECKYGNADGLMALAEWYRKNEWF